jgi:hypothetical protein
MNWVIPRSSSQIVKIVTSIKCIFFSYGAHRSISPRTSRLALPPLDVTEVDLNQPFPGVGLTQFIMHYI